MGEHWDIKHRFIILVLLIMIMSPLNGLFHSTVRHKRPYRTALAMLGSTSSRGGLGNKPMRLERIISNRGVASRNDVAKLLKQGRVTVDGEVVRKGAARYPVNIRGLCVDDEPVDPLPLLAAFHKPVGVHSTMGDPRNRDNLADLCLEYPFLKSLHPVGRLDADTSGLLLFSSDGQLTQTLLHPSTGIQREYEAVVVGQVDHESLKAKLTAGVETTEGTFTAELVDGTIVYEEEVRAIFDMEGRLVPKGRQTESTSTVKGTRASRVRLTVTEGKYRMVRRVLHNAGHSVIHLHRTRYGGMDLGGLEKGGVRVCSVDEEQWAGHLLGWS
jgi:23S rRNA pseudouridine2605 synthase